MSNQIMATLSAAIESSGHGFPRHIINDETFPAAVVPGLEGAELVGYDDPVSTEFVLADLKGRGRRAANAAELLLYGISMAKKRRAHHVAAIGQIWIMPEHVEHHNGHRYDYPETIYVIELDGNDAPQVPGGLQAGDLPGIQFVPAGLKSLVFDVWRIDHPWDTNWAFLTFPL